jgi:adenylate cyclase
LFTPLTRIIYRQKGVIDKYMGDAVMAFWGAPLPDAEHAAHAVAAAFEIQEELLRLADDFRARNWPAIRMGIGINTGVMRVGNMGSTYRMAYTVVGDAVNLAARLQDLTRVFRTRIIVGERTRRAFPAPTYRELGLVQVRGKNSLVRIYEPCNPAIDPESTLVANMTRHNEALANYYARDWETASEQFMKLKSANPRDPLYDYYLKRIAEYRQNPPPPDWRGELRFTVK